MKNLILILISVISINCYSQVKQTKQTVTKKTMVKNDISDKDYTEQKIKIEWENDGVVNRQVIRYYKDCKDFYSSTNVDPSQVKCYDINKVMNGRACDITENGNMQNIEDCQLVKCPECTTCRELADQVSSLGGVLIRCWETSRGVEGEIEMLKLVRKLHKMDPDKMKIKN